MTGNITNCKDEGNRCAGAQIAIQKTRIARRLSLSFADFHSVHDPLAGANGPRLPRAGRADFVANNRP